MANTNIAQNIINGLISRAQETVLNNKALRKVPRFLLSGVNKSVEQVKIYSINNDKGPKHKPIFTITDHESMRTDNFTPGKCRILPNPNPSIQNIHRSYSRQNRTLSMRSQKHSSVKELTARRQNIAKTQKKLQGNKNGRNFISLYSQTKDQVQEVNKQQKLRKELVSKRQEIDRINWNLQEAKRKTSQKRRKGASQIGQSKSGFTFNYDFSILKFKSLHKQKAQESQSTNNRSLKCINSCHQIPQLLSRVKKSQDLTNKKQQIPQVQIPQIVLDFNKNKKQNASNEKSKPYHREIIFNNQGSKSLIELISKESKVQKGVVVKQLVDGKADCLKKQSIKIEKKIKQLNRKEFQQSFAMRKFVSRIQKNINDI